jgi:DNA-binding transcriptional regulator of glucitol operon
MTLPKVTTMSEKKSTRGWVVVLIVAVIALAFYLGGSQAVSEMTANGELQYTETVKP